MKLPEQLTIGDKYGPAMEITEQAQADEYFAALVAHNMRSGRSQEEAEEIERTNLGYFAGYYSHETRARVEQLFRCAHPFFWAIVKNGAPTPQQAFDAGVRFAEGGAS